MLGQTAGLHAVHEQPSVGDGVAAGEGEVVAFQGGHGVAGLGADVTGELRAVGFAGESENEPGAGGEVTAGEGKAAGTNLGAAGRNTCATLGGAGWQRACAREKSKITKQT